MSSYGEGDGDSGALVEPEGVNAGSPVDDGPPPAEESGRSGTDQAEGAADRDGPRPNGEGQGQGEMLSRPGSANGLTRPGPGQEFSAEEG